MSAAYHLAQVNIATIRAPLDSPTMADFVNNLDLINALAENTPGFVWRLKTDDGNATSLKVYDDARIIVNMSVWESADALFQYVYYSDHTAFYRRRTEWFERMTTPMLALWWVPAGQTPTTDDAKQRLDHLEQHGATPYAFTIKQRFTAQEAAMYANARMESA